MAAFVPRYYQSDAFCNSEKLLMEGLNNIILMATGTGKTHVIGMQVEAALKRNERVLVLAHAGILLNQADSKIFDHTGQFPDREQSKLRAATSSQVVTASVASLRGARLARFPKDHFDLIIVDECHRSVAKSYMNIFEHFDSAKIVGYTATADRPDEKSLSLVYDAVAYEYPLSVAVKQGHLCPIKGRKVDSFEMDLNDIKLSAGDIPAEEIERLIETHLIPIAENVIKETAERNKVLLFLPDVKSSELMRDTLAEMGHPSGCVSGQMKDHENNTELARFHSGEYKYMCSCQKLIEGYDEPAIDCVVMLRPTLSRIVYSQGVGRGTRLFPGKTDLLLLEFTFNSSKHKLVSAFELAGGTYDQRIVEEAQQAARDKDDVDILDSLDEIQKEFFSIKSILSRAKSKDIGFVSFDPLGLGDLLDLDLHSQTEAWFEGKKLTGKATDKQRSILERFMVDSAGMDKGEASKVISGLFEKETPMYKGPASPAQMRLLKNLIGPDIPSNLTKAMASLLISKRKEELQCEAESKNLQLF